MKKTGELLKKAREAKGLSLNEIGLSLKISSKTLKAIEDGDETSLPAKTFLRGFVQSYATYLRMDVEAVMASFYEEVGSTRPKPLMRTTSEEIDPSTASGEKNAAVEDARESHEPAAENKIPKKTATSAKEQDHLAPINHKSNTKTIVIAVIGAVLLGFILFTKKMIDKYSKEAQVDDKVTVSEPLPSASPETGDENETNPNPNEAPDEKLDSKNSSEAPKPEPSPSVISSLAHIKPSPSPQPATTPSPSPTPKAVASPSPTPTPSQTPSPSPTPTPTPSPSVTATPTPTPSPSPSAEEKPVSKSIELIIEALDNVEIEYSSNTGKTSTLKLTAEQVHTFKSKNGLKLNISNGGAVNLILNGRDQGIPGDLGKPIKLSY
jgi:cytoskeleton protein RodZ